MDTWIFQGGHPAVAVDVDGDTVTLRQERFRFDGGDASARWAIPVLVRAVDAGTTDRVLLDGDSTSLTVAGASSGVVVNAGGHGFYRVRHSDASLAMLRTRVGELASVERALLLDDTWASVLAGQTSATAFLELAEAFGDETEPAVWTTLIGGLSTIDRILDGDDRSRLQLFVRSIAGRALERLGWEPTSDEPELVGQTRQLLIGATGSLGADPDTIARARALLEREQRDGDVDPNVASAVVSVVAHDGTADEWQRYLERHHNAGSPQEQLRYLYALGLFPGADQAERTLELSITEIRSQNAMFVLLTLLQNRNVNALAWDFVKREWAAIEERLPDNAIPRFLGGVTALDTPEQLADVEAFLGAHPVPHGARTVTQHLERQRVNVAFRTREAAPIAAWLAGRLPEVR
jgi:puromycin-sensitive aminopeptidase